ncbi:hypothetical protein [Marinimicrobium sp. C2-29]|uniref:hypothetical protein n=1 Tax=Marinimicrobium sp. C2-29 TaxID=3139825 RepID=UPI0031397F19
MQINDISANIDAKMHRLEQQLANLNDARERVSGDTDAQAVIDQDIQVLMDMRAKLVKSRDLAWQVHQLGQQTQEQNLRIRRHRRLGLGLIIFSGVALVGLLIVYLVAF